MRVAFVFPGQGSQSVGMLAALGAVSPLVRDTFAEASSTLGYDLWKLAQEGPAEELNRTECTQPAMLAAGVATWRFWREAGGALPEIVCGHSLGEFTALVCAGVLDYSAALQLVAFRARAMQEAVPVGTGAMAAILGLEDAEDIRSLNLRSGLNHDLKVFTDEETASAPGQVGNPTLAKEFAFDWLRQKLKSTRHAATKSEGALDC